MSKELTPELKKQISNEAEGNTRDFRDNNDYEAGVIKGYMEGYEVAGEYYALKWQQEAEYSVTERSKLNENIQRYEKALRDIISPIAYLQRKADEEGAGLDGHYAQELANSVSFLQSISIEALLPKQTTDDTDR